MLQPTRGDTFAIVWRPRWWNVVGAVAIGFAWIGLVLLGGSLLGQRVVHAMAPLIGVVPMLGLFVATPRRYRVDEHGLILDRYLAPSIHWPWERLGEVTVEPTQLRVATDRGELCLGPAVSARGALARLIEARRPGGVDEPPTTDLPAEQIEAWLGVERGQAVRIELFEDWRLTVVVLLLVVSVGWPLLSMVLFGTVGLWPIVSAACWVVFGVTMALQMVREASVDGAGIHLRGPRVRRFVPWSAVRGVSERRDLGLTGTVHTEVGDLAFRAADRPEVQRLLSAARQVVEARDAGQQARQTETASDAALSRAEQTVAIARGLSREE